MANSEHIEAADFLPEDIGRFVGSRVLVTITAKVKGETQVLQSAVGVLAGAQRSNWLEKRAENPSSPTLWFEGQAVPITVPIAMPGATVNIFFLHKPTDGSLGSWAGRD